MWINIFLTSKLPSLAKLPFDSKWAKMAKISPKTLFFEILIIVCIKLEETIKVLPNFRGLTLFLLINFQLISLEKLEEA